MIEGSQCANYAVPESVAKELAELRAENARLLRLLKLTRAEAAPPGPAQAGLFDAPPGPVQAASPAEAKVALFGALFAARTDIYAVRWENDRTGRAGWLPAVSGGWRRGVPHAERDYLPLTAEVLAAHLSGQVHIGLYPLLDGDRCWWLAADFDGPAALLDALNYIKAARALNVPSGPISRPHPHMLRHTFVTTMLDAGVGLRDVQVAGRHADPRTTMRYDRARRTWTATPTTSSPPTWPLAPEPHPETAGTAGRGGARRQPNGAGSRRCRLATAGQSAGIASPPV
ncbi:MAG: tyrosine-type recombinase/integrase [Streptosporangiaceae bacterium]|nr:tyrosine-type recombinase/integrase [Streptosporangiaceae bacterium]